MLTPYVPKGITGFDDDDDDYVGWYSAVGIATRYGLDGQGSNADWGEIFRTHLDWPWGPPSLLYNGYRVSPGGKAVGAWR